MINFSIAQSNRWLFGEEYVDVQAIIPNSPLPSLAGYTCFDGSGFNMRHDQNNDLSFFIDGGVVYNENIVELGRINVNTSTGQAPFLGYPEICIVPVPGACSQYYIISANIYEGGGFDGTNPRPSFVTIDMDVYNTVANAYGSLLGANSGNWVISTDISNGSGTWTNFSVHTSEMHLAVTRPRSDGNRILFISSGGQVYASTITNSGISTANLVFSTLNSNGSNPGSGVVKSELEVYEQQLNGVTSNYILAIPRGTTQNDIEVVNLDQNLNPINSFVVGPLISSITNPLKGIEFSPNGQYIYYTTTVPDYLHCIDVSSGTSIQLPNINQSALMKYGYSMIETGIDNKLYMVCIDCSSPNNPNSHTIITQLNNPNNPSNLTFVDNWAELSTSHIAGFQSRQVFFATGNYVELILCLINRMAKIT
ncbi:MAG: hypothetical protein IPK10_10430 [Bacteroidetes bacterium]|nr:hypothetical protein [Bacteroidota bacterium]